VIVAGAGIIGLSCAWRLSQAGVPVTIVDRGECGGEASWAGAGMLAPGGEFETSTPLAELALGSLAQYPSYVAELQEETGAVIDYRQCGAVELAFTEDEDRALTARAGGQQAIGIYSRRERFNGYAARFYPNDAVVNPRDITRALLSACRRRGVRVIEHDPVLEILEDGAGVRTTLAEYRDNGVLIAAGAWSSGLVPGLPGTIPVRGHLIGYRLAPGFLTTILRNRDTYLLQRNSGLLIAGSTTEHVGFDRTVNPEIVQDIHCRATHLLPALSARQPDESWIGFRPGIEAEGPRIGRIAGKRIWTAFGHYRNGILLAPETARRVTECVAKAT
jgi:glycine oxidase